MGRRHIYNFEVVAKDVCTNWHVKDFQHFFRKQPRINDSQSTSSGSQLTNTGRQVKELLKPTPPVSQVEFKFRENSKLIFSLFQGSNSSQSSGISYKSYAEQAASRSGAYLGSQPRKSNTAHILPRPPQVQVHPDPLQVRPPDQPVKPPVQSKVS